MKKYLLTVLFSTFSICASLAAHFYVSATATAAGDGSKDNPWQLQKALNAPAPLINPTDTIWVWLLGGTYKGTFDAQTSFNCFTNGTQTSPIIFRNYNSQRVTLDGNLTYTLMCNLGKCSYTWFWGLEVMNSDTSDRDHSNINRMGNVYCTAENMKFINMIVHDLGSGLDTWKTATNTETYGCIIYHIGNNLKNGVNWEGHGHGMYLQNDTLGVKNIHNNIIFSTYGYGMKVWQTTNTEALGNFDIQRNVVFNGGAACENLGGVGNNSRTHNFFVVSNSVNNPIRNTTIKHNYTYAGSNTPRPPVNAFGLNYGVQNMTLDSNYLTCQTRLGYNNTPVFNASFKGNKIIAGIPPVYGFYLWGFTNTDYPLNTYIPIEPTTGLEYFILPNKYETGRSHLVVYNWDSAAQVKINLSEAGLQAGDIYELINVMDYYRDIITDTLNHTGIISLPMTGHTFAPIVGSAKAPVSQFPKFGVFVIRKVGQSKVVGLSDLPAINPKLEVFPNPVSTQCSLRFYSHKNEDCDIWVTDYLGKSTLIGKIKCTAAKEQQFHLDLSDFPAGFYLIRVKSQGLSLQATMVLKK